MMRSLFSGVSGLRIHQTKMDVIGNNIANVNTVGYKASRVTFRDAFYQRLQGAAGANPETGRAGTNPQQIGLGAALGSIDTLMGQGLSQRTDRSLDIMIQGDGFFIVSDSSGLYFTRAGNVDLDADMNMHINGLRLMGWDRRFIPETGEWVIETGPVKPLDLSGDKQYMEPEATTVIKLEGNLTPTGMVGTPPQTERTMSFIDSLGNPFIVDVVYTYHGQSTATNAQGDPIHGFWTYEFKTDADGFVLAYPDGDYRNPKKIAMDITIPGEDPAESASEANALIRAMNSKGILVFDTNGTLVASGPLNGANAGTPYNLVPPAAAITNGMINSRLIFDEAQISELIIACNGGPDFRRQIQLFTLPFDATDPPSTFGRPSDVEHDYSDAPHSLNYDPADLNIKPYGIITLDMSDLNQWNGKNVSVKFVEKDGNPPGVLRDVSVGPDGKITGRYSNGRTRLLGQIPVARFQNPAGLEKMGNNLFAITTNSGPFDGIGETGDIMGGALEMSNVDLSQEFTEMITTQRGFQANSRIISVSDEMLQELVNLKR